MIRINRILLFLLLSLPLALTSCSSEPARISIVQKGDYSELLAAIRSADQSLSAKLGLIENAVSSGLADNQQAVELIEEAIRALEGTLAEKLSAIEQAIKDQTTSLMTKLGLLEAAVKGGFTNARQQQDLLLQAIQSMGGTLEEKLAAIESAVKSQTTSLETKIGLIEAAVQGGFADAAQAQDLAAQAIEAMGKTSEEKLAAVEAAVKSATASLEAKLLLIETAVKEGFSGESNIQDLLKSALDALDGTMEDKLAAIQTAMTSQSSGLEAKIALIVAALQNGFSGVNSAIENLQQAMDTSLQGIDSALPTLSSDIATQLQAIAGQLSPTELSKALQDVLDAIDSDNQTTEDIIKSIQESLDTIQAAVGGSGVTITDLIYLGSPTERITVSVGQPIKILLRVTPSNATLTENMLQLDQKDRQQFFLSGADRSQAVKNHFPSFTVEPDPNTKGQYIVSIRTLVDETYKYWDETSLVFKVKTGEENGQNKYASTLPIPVAIMPRPHDGLSVSGRENTSTFMITGYGGYGKPSLGNIYQPLVSVVFRDGSNTRVYTPEFLRSAEFDALGQLPVSAILEKEKHCVRLFPDTTKTEWMELKDSTVVNHKEVLGSLELTDQWGGSSSFPLSHSLGWYTAYADTVLADPTISSDGKLQANLASKATALGLNLGEHPGSTYCKVKFDFASASGAWLSAQFKPYSWDLEMQLMTYPSGSRFTVDAAIVQYVQPCELDSDYRPMQRGVRIRVTFTVK